MPMILNQPDNVNFLSPLGFKFVLKRTPNLVYFLTDVNLPSVTLGNIEYANPFKIIDLPGDNMDYGDLQVTFRVDEDFANYLEILNWMKGLGSPNSFDEYSYLSKQATGSGKGLYCDASLFVLNSSMVPNIQIDFIDVFPVALSDINLTVTDSDVNYVVNTVTFKYKIWNIKKL